MLFQKAIKFVIKKINIKNHEMSKLIFKETKGRPQCAGTLLYERLLGSDKEADSDAIRKLG